ncbi:BtpA/SgcQ family protein [Candidatus Bathyarchaeota archaeon]|nr:BtpA/SgcQ family protein [Candidatus Bathyarchaeota archaeon]
MREKRVQVIGMLHLDPLPGSPHHDEHAGLDLVLANAINDLNVYLDHEIDGVIFENFGDVPFYPGTVPPETLSSMTWIITKCQTFINKRNSHENFLVGVNVLRNDPIGALSIALVTGSHFIRVNIHDGVSLTDQGLIQGKAHETLRYRRNIGANEVKILADVHVKHATPLVERELHQESLELVKRGGADGLIFTGPMTGISPRMSTFECIPRIKLEIPKIPLFLGSGVNHDNILQIFDIVGNSIDGMIIGTAFKEGGKVSRPVERERVKSLMALVNDISI